VDIVKVEGNNYEVGFSVGKQTKEKIRYFLTINRSKVERILAEKSLVSSIEKECEKFSPELLEELEGIANGSELPFEELLAFNIADSIGNMLVIDCSSIIEKNADKVYFGHNEDWTVGANSLFLLDMKVNDTRIFAFAYYGLLAGISFSTNSNGLFFTMNSLLCTDIRPAVPRSFVNRKVIQSKSIEEAIETIKNAKRSRGQNYNIFTRDEIVNVESSATNLFVRKNLRVLYHTNHYTTEKMLKYENRKNNFVMKQSKMRLHTIEKLSKELKDLPSEERLLRILSSHENYPFTVCIHNLDFGNDRKVKTFATVIGNTDKEIMFTMNNPCYGNFEKLKL